MPTATPMSAVASVTTSPKRNADREPQTRV